MNSGTAISDKKKTNNSVSEEIFTMLQGLNKRELEIISMRYGIGSHNEHTLESIGQSYLITRERVRQIESATLEKLAFVAQSNSLKEFFIKVSEIMKQNGGVLSQARCIDMLKNFYNTNTEKVGNIFRLCMMLHPHIENVSNTIQLHPFYTTSAVSSSKVREIAQFCIAILKKSKKVMTMEALLHEIKKIHTTEISVITLRNIFELAREIKITNAGLVGLTSWEDINPRNVHAKIKFILNEHKKPMHFTELTSLIVEKSFDQKRITLQAVHNELIRSSDFVLIGRGIYALASWGYLPGTVAETIARILATGPKSRDQILKEVAKQKKVKKMTILLNLKNPKKFDRVGRDMYALKK